MAVGGDAKKREKGQKTWVVQGGDGVLASGEVTARVSRYEHAVLSVLPGHY